MTLPVYYINLDTRADRRAFMEGQFASLGITATRVPARDGNGTLRDGKLSAAQVGCIESHLAAWQALLAEAAPAAIILEDDAVLGSGFAELLQDEALRSDWFDVLRLETRLRKVRLGRAHGGSIAPFVARRQLSSLAGCAGYVITRGAAATLSRSPVLGRKAFDHFLFGPPTILDMRVMQAIPAPVVALEFHQPGRPEAVSSIKSTMSGGSRRRLASQLRSQLGLAMRYPIFDTLRGLRPREIPFSGA